jgi:hypothetical protein
MFGGQPSIRLDAEAFEDCDQLARVLRGVPGGALEELVHRRRAIESPHLLKARFVFEPSPPGLDALDHAVAVSGDLRSGGEGSIRRRHVGVVCPVLNVVNRGLEESFTDTENVMPHEPDRTVTVVDHALVEPLGGDLADVALRRAQNGDPFHDQDCGRKRRVSGALQTDELGDILEVLAEDVLFAFCEYGYRARAELEQLLSSVRIVQYVQRDEANAFFRKKLFRSQATASTGLGEKDEIFAVCFHFE